VSIRDREGRPLRGPVVGQQSASHADSSVRVVPAKIKSRIQIRRADKIELKMAIGFRRKSLLLNIENPENSIKWFGVNHLWPDFEVISSPQKNKTDFSGFGISLSHGPRVRMLRR
jgi:hypothetical protein